MKSASKTSRTAMRRGLINWPEKFRQWRESGQTITKFCRENGLNQKSFFNNRKKFEPEQAQSPFIPLAVRASSPLAVHLEITFARGKQVRVSGDFSVEDLARMLSLLGRVP